MRTPGTVASLVAALPRAWVAVLLVVAALDLAVVAAGTGARTAEAAAGIAPLVARVGTATLVADGRLVADDGTHATASHALVVDRGAEAATVSAPAGRDALVLAGDGAALLVGGGRWTVAYVGSLTADDLHALLAGWREAQRGTAVLSAALTGALTVALATAVLSLGARVGGRLVGPRRPAPAVLRPGDAVAWWAASLALASAAAAAVVLGTDGAPGRTPALAGTLVLATAGVCLLAAASARGRPSDPPPAPAVPTTTAAP